MNPRQLLGVTATRQAMNEASKFLSYLPNPDPILKRQGKDVSIYRDLLIDGHVGSCIQSRKAGVLERTLVIGKGKKGKEVDLLRSVYADLDMPRIIEEALDAFWFGIQPMEVYWRPVAGSLVVPRDVVGKPQEWFQYDQHNVYRLRKLGSKEGHLLPPKKFLLVRHKPRYIQPYGEAIASKCFWEVTFKRGGVRFWVDFLEKYGTPYTVEKYKAGTLKPAELELRADKLEEMVQDAVILIPDTSSFEVVSAAGTGSGPSYQALAYYCDGNVSKAILSQTLSTEVGEVGSYAAAQAHLTVRKDVIGGDMGMLIRLLTYFNKMILDVNYASYDYVPLPEFEDLAEAQTQKIARDVAIAGTGMAHFTKNHWTEEYGINPNNIIDLKPELSLPSAGGTLPTGTVPALPQGSPGSPEGAFPPTPVSEGGAPQPTPTGGDPNEAKGVDEPAGTHSIGPGSFAQVQKKAADGQDAVNSFADIMVGRSKEAMATILAPVMRALETSDDPEEVRRRLPEIFDEMDSEEFEALLGMSMFLSEVTGAHTVKAE
jgi:phage gp29-like protein